MSEANSMLLERIQEVYISQKVRMNNLKNEFMQESCLSEVLQNSKFNCEIVNFQRASEHIEKIVQEDGPLIHQVNLLKKEKDALEARKSMIVQKKKSLGDLNSKEQLEYQVQSLNNEIQTIKADCQRLVNELINFRDDELYELRTIQQNYYLRMKASNSQIHASTTRLQ